MNSEMNPRQHLVTASVVIPAFTFDRWDNIVKAVDAVQAQSRLPAELILSIDRNPGLFRACQDRWGSAELPVPVKVVANDTAWVPRVATEANSDGVARGYGGGSARNVGARLATGDVIVTFDDDAWPDPECLAYLVAPYEDPSIAAVGGSPIPYFETARPRWFPSSFDWIFGCAYEGLPTGLGPTPRLIARICPSGPVHFVHSAGFESLTSMISTSAPAWRANLETAPSCMSREQLPTTSCRRIGSLGVTSGAAITWSTETR